MVRGWRRPPPDETPRGVARGAAPPPWNRLCYLEIPIVSMCFILLYISILIYVCGPVYTYIYPFIGSALENYDLIWSLAGESCVSKSGSYTEPYIVWSATGIDWVLSVHYYSKCVSNWFYLNLYYWSRFASWVIKEIYHRKTDKKVSIMNQHIIQM